jgi:phosphoribosylanthranilate isomerase
MFTIKICGITTPGDARLALDAGADAIGINFCAASPRFVPPERALHITAAAKGLTRVGVFVNADAETVCGVYDGLALDAIQLHGDEPPSLLTELGRRPVIRAFRVGLEGLRPVAAYLAECNALGVTPRAVLLDAHVDGQYGGTGVTANWQLIADQRGDLGGLPMILAGGLNCDNVAAAITATSADAVDVASGVESTPITKDDALVRRFVAEARTRLPAPVRKR